MFKRRRAQKRERLLEVMSNRHAWYGLDLLRVTGLSSGTLYSLLDELEKEGIVMSFWDDVNVQDDLPEQTRRRRLYTRWR